MLLGSQRTRSYNDKVYSYWAAKFWMPNLEHPRSQGGGGTGRGKGGITWFMPRSHYPLPASPLGWVQQVVQFHALRL